MMEAWFTEICVQAAALHYPGKNKATVRDDWLISPRFGTWLAVQSYGV